MLSESGRDPRVDGGDLFIQCQDCPRQGVHHRGGRTFPSHGGVLCLGRGDGRISYGLGATDFAVLQPGREPARADPAQTDRGLVAGQEDECSFEAA